MFCLVLLTQGSAWMIVSDRMQAMAAADFAVVLTVAVTTLLLSCLVIVPALGTLRKRHPEVLRAYRVPGGTWGFRICLAVVYVWIVIGSWVALFPGTLNSLLGESYSFADTWGLSQGVFEVFTLGTVGVLLCVGAIGRVVALRRDREVAISEPIQSTAS